MLVFEETKWQLLRKKGRTILLILASFMLAACLAFYLGNIRANEEALEQLAQSTDVEVMVTNATGENSAGLNIDTLRCDNFIKSNYLDNFRLSAAAVGAYSEDSKAEPTFTGGDVNVLGLSCIEATWMPDGKFFYAEGYDETFLAGEEAQCLMDKTLAEENNISMGAQVSLPIYLVRYHQGGAVEYVSLGEQSIQVVGFSSSNIIPQAFIVPVNWLRKTAENQDVPFIYGSCSGYMKDPRQLNRFKSEIESMSFLKPNPEAQDQFGGSTIVIEDEQFISSAETLGENIFLFRQFQAPFFILIIALVVLAIFLIMRSSQRDIAIACSLGRSKFLSTLGSFFAAFTAEIVGCILMLPVAVIGAGLSLGGSLLICGAFMLCASIGNILGLALIIRFDTFTMLTAAE